MLPYILPGTWFSRNELTPTPRWAGANVRCLSVGDLYSKIPKGSPKYRALNLTERGHFYPHPDVEPTQGSPTALIVEGELDGLLAWQEAGHVMQVGTIGGATSNAKPSVAEALDHCPRWLIATDYDEGGDDAAWYWRGVAPAKSCRALLPFGKDLGEFHQAGGDVLAWLRAEHERLRWPWPLAQR